MNAIISSVNYQVALPVICVFVLGVFLFTLFLKQKNH